MSIERVVAIATPAFAALSGLVTTVVGQAVPGVSLSRSDLTALFVTGATAAGAAALKWLHGRSQFTQAIGSVDAVADRVVANIHASPAGPAAADIEAMLKAHTDQIVRAIAGAVHAPPSIEEIAQAMARAAVQHAPAAPGHRRRPVGDHQR